MSGTCFDDLLRAETSEYKRNTSQTADKLNMAEEEALLYSFTGFHLSPEKQGNLVMEQNEYLAKLKPLPTEASLNYFSSLRIKLA